MKDENETSVQAKITKRKTTKEELKTTFGSSMSVTFNSDGNEMWVYNFASVSADAVNFIPFVGLFGSSYSGENKML